MLHSAPNRLYREFPLSCINRWSACHKKGIASKGGTRKTNKVWERIGRLKEKYSSTHQYYEIKVSDNSKGSATSLVFEKKTRVTINDKTGIWDYWPIGSFQSHATN